MNPQPVCIIDNRLYWISSQKPPKDIKKAFFFNIDNDLVYEGFYEDFGPLNIGKIWRYVTEVNKILTDPAYTDNIFYHHTSTDYKKSSNACLLICCYSIIMQKRSAQQAYHPFKNIQFESFRDASYGQCTYKCTILDCLRGLEYAIRLKWFDFKKFNITEYEHLEKVQNGDLNWIIPGKFIAFSTPCDKSSKSTGYKLFSPKDYVPIFKQLGVVSVIRLNTKTYQAQQFMKNNISHTDMYFTDGTSPPLEIVGQFLNYCENIKGAIAVHCKAGLGRTGTLIACYAIKHYNFNSADFIGWIRLCRPGSILGPQQHFLIQNEKKLKLLSKQSPIWKQISSTFSSDELQKQLNSMSIKETKMNQKEKYIQAHGDNGQGEKLNAAKKKIYVK